MALDGSEFMAMIQYKYNAYTLSLSHSLLFVMLTRIAGISTLQTQLCLCIFGVCTDSPGDRLLGPMSSHLARQLSPKEGSSQSVCACVLIAVWARWHFLFLCELVNHTHRRPPIDRYSGLEPALSAAKRGKRACLAWTWLPLVSSPFSHSPLFVQSTHVLEATNTVLPFDNLYSVKSIYV